MANKFLGLDSVNVLVKYIDQSIAKKQENALVITVQAYKYYRFTETPSVPQGGGYNFTQGEITWPEGGWNTLSRVIRDLCNNDMTALESALMDGAIWMSSAIITAAGVESWSTPMKVSGQNGVGVKFKYAYDVNATEWTDVPSGVSAEQGKRVEYVWTKCAESDWVGPTIWSMYAQDADNVLWRWCVTSEKDENDVPVKPAKPGVGNTIWVNNLALLNLSKEIPYMWMSSKNVPAGQNENDCSWSEPVLFGHWGMDGNVPDFNVTLYRIGNNLEGDDKTPGIVKPSAPTYDGLIAYDEFRTANTEWKDLPEDDNKVWWQCTIKVDGQTNEVMEVGSVKRYNAVDGEALPGQFTKYLYCWSATQAEPDFDEEELEDEWRPTGWYERPDYDIQEDWEGDINSEKPESSLWMISAIAMGMTDGGTPDISEWTAPIKISGPRGPIAYDYRIETRYNIGTATKPMETPTEAEWYKTAPQITTQYPYVWANNHLVLYRMRYGELDEATGEYEIVPDDSGRVIETYDYFRLSGLDGEDGNRKNSLKYSTQADDFISVTSFSTTNYYISNSDGHMTYEMNLDQLSFINGYTGKFANVGTADITLKTGSNFKFVGSNTEATEFTLSPQETVELVCYNNGKDKELIVIGKSLASA